MALTLGPDWQNELWASPYRLRFELAVGETSITRFSSSYDRARALARAALGVQNPMAVIHGVADPRRDFFFRREARLFHRSRTSYEILETLGVSTANAEAAWLGYRHPEEIGDEEVEPDSEQRAVRVTWDQADILLFCQVAYEIGVTPIAPVDSKLLDLERAICVYAYDDRGMDITALSREALVPLYHQFDGWLLDHDRERMAAVFD